MDEQDKKLPYRVRSKEEMKLTHDYPVCLEDEYTGICYLLPYGKWVIGREDKDVSKKPDVSIDTEDLYISRRHAMVTVDTDFIDEIAVRIRDFKEVKNHTRVLLNEVAEVMNTDSDYDLYDQYELLIGKTWFIIHRLS